MVTFHCTPSLITCITWTYCMHPVQGAIAPRGWDLCISPPQPWIQLFNRNTKLPHCVQQGYPSYSQCLPNFEHEFQCWLNDFTLEIPDISDKLRRWPCALTGFSHVLRCSSMASGGFPPVFFTKKNTSWWVHWWLLGGFSGSAPAGAFLVDTSRHAFCCCIVVVNDYQGTLTKTMT